MSTKIRWCLIGFNASMLLFNVIKGDHFLITINLIAIGLFLAGDKE